MQQMSIDLNLLTILVERKWFEMIFRRVETQNKMSGQVWGSVSSVNTTAVILCMVFHEWRGDVSCCLSWSFGQVSFIELPLLKMSVEGIKLK